MKSKYEILTDIEFISCYNDSNSFNEFYQKMGYSDSHTVNSNIRKCIKDRMNSLGLSEDKFCKHAKMNICKVCGRLTRRKFFCSRECNIKFNKQEKINHWKETGDTGCGVMTTLRNCIRDYILEKQNNCCAICGMKNIWNGKVLNFILDHIDGNASNNHENNLRLICPNCDSQLETYKSKNKKSARNLRYAYA